MSFSGNRIDEYQNRTKRRTTINKKSLEQALAEANNSSSSSSSSSKSSPSSKSSAQRSKSGDESEEQKDFFALSQQYQHERKRNQVSFATPQQKSAEKIQFDASKARGGQRATIIDQSRYNTPGNKSLLELNVQKKLSKETVIQEEPLVEEMEVEEIVIQEQSIDDILNETRDVEKSIVENNKLLEEMFRPSMALTQSLYRKNSTTIRGKSSARMPVQLEDDQYDLGKDSFVDYTQERLLTVNARSVVQLQDQIHEESSSNASEEVYNQRKGNIHNKLKSPMYSRRHDIVFDYGDNAILQDIQNQHLQSIVCDAISQDNNNNDDDELNHAEPGHAEMEQPEDTSSKGLSSNSQSFTQEDFLKMSNMNDNEKYYRMMSTGENLKEGEEQDLLTIVDLNERRHKDIASEQLKQDSVFTLKLAQQEEVKNKIMSDFKTKPSITAKTLNQFKIHGTKATCIGLSDELILVANSVGQLWMFDRESEEEYAMFAGKDKEFHDNAITAIDVHPTRSEYVVLGYNMGQLMLMDLTEPKKPLKTIKDHHKRAISNVQFCDWRGKIQENEPGQSISSKNADKQIWMFVSLDVEGKVIITTVEKIMFIFKASKHTIIDPSKNNMRQMPIFSSLACRFHSQLYSEGDDNDSVTLIALGSKDLVQIMSVKPGKHFEVMNIYRQNKIYTTRKNQWQDVQPKYPSMSWGYGHSPALKDKCYSILAIGWGPLVQLCVLNDIYSEGDDKIFKDGFYLLRPDGYNYKPKSQQKQLNRQSFGNSDDEEEENYFDDEALSYEDPQLNIENVVFISDGILLVLLANLEIRILYTQQFSPREYLPAIKTGSIAEQIIQQKKEDTIKAELGQSIHLRYLIKQEHGVVYHQTLKFYKGMVVALTFKDILTSQHLSWIQFLNNYKNEVKGDLVKIFARALAIYQGQIKGYSGVSEDKEFRENILKANLKLLLKEIMCEVIEKWSQQNIASEQTRRGTMTSAQSFATEFTLDDSAQMLGRSSVVIPQYNSNMNTQADIDQRKIDRFRLLIRIAIEFCVELQDCYFLFYDLFLLFQEEKMESIFVEEMEPFIMAGRFQEWELPNDILQNHIINYFKDPEKPENLEKIIINLNFNQCPKPVVLELVHFSEQHFLSTAILFLYTQVFERKDDSSCVQVLFSLYKLYKNAKQREGSINEIRTMIELPNNSEQRLTIEKTQTYLGYKILWVIKLFLSGKKFPSGNIRDRKWRTYVHDIIEFVTTQDILDNLLEIDAECFFQIMSVIFYEGKVFDYVKMGRALPAGSTSDDVTVTSMTHKDFLRKLDQYCQRKEGVSEDIKQSYLFFVANVVAKSQAENDDPQFYYRIVKELLRLHKRFLIFNRHLLQRAMSKNKLLRRMSRAMGQSKKVSDEVKYVYKCETDLVRIMEMCEPMDTNMINELLKLAEYTQFNQVKVYLLEKKQDYIKCLQLFLSGIKVGAEVTTSKQSEEKAFKWIREKLSLLEEQAGESAHQKHIYESFKREVTQNVKQMIQFNALEAFKLIDERYNGNHKDIIEQLHRDPQEQLKYLEALLMVKDQYIENTIRDYSLKSGDAQEAKRYLEYLKLHLRLCCQLQREKVLSIVEKIVKHSYYPTEDCLHICQEYNQLEASALLNKKLGKYFDSVQQYIKVMKDETVVPLDVLKKELIVAYAHRISTEYQIQNEAKVPVGTKFDQLLKRVMKICKKNYREVDIGQEEEVWYIVLDTLFMLKNKPEVATDEHAKTFFASRISMFVYALIENIPFKNFLNHALKVSSTLNYGELKEIIMNLFYDSKSELNVTSNAKNTIVKVNTDLFESFQSMSGNGILFRSRQCFLCKRYFDGFLTGGTELGLSIDDEDVTEAIKIYQCRHTFHVHCLIKNFKAHHEGIKDDQIKKKLDKERCPQCYSKSFDIDGENGSPSRPRQRVSNAPAPGRKVSITNKVDDDTTALNNNMLSSSPKSSPDKESEEKKRRQQKIRTETVIRREWVKFNNIMQSFDHNNEGDAMTSKNFKL